MNNAFFQCARTTASLMSGSIVSSSAVTEGWLLRRRHIQIKNINSESAVVQTKTKWSKA